MKISHGPQPLWNWMRRLQRDKDQNAKQVTTNRKANLKILRVGLYYSSSIRGAADSSRKVLEKGGNQILGDRTAVFDARYPDCMWCTRILQEGPISDQ